jgi:hypothetical protein
MSKTLGADFARDRRQAPFWENKAPFVVNPTR